MVLIPRVFKDDKQIEQELHEPSYDRRLAQNHCMPHFGKNRARSLSPIEHQISRLSEKIEIQDLTIEYLVRTIKSLQDSIEKKNRLESYKAVSSRNSETLRSIFDLPALSGEISGNPLRKLKGLMKDYSDKNTDAVELLRIARGE